MLQTLNERIKGFVAWVILGIVAITFALLGVDYYVQSRQQAAAVKVRVNGEPISKQIYDINYRRMRQQQNAQNSAKYTAVRDSLLQKQLLNNMITHAVSIQAAKANGFEVSSAEANNAILAIPQFQENGHFSAELYRQALNNALFTPESFHEEVRQGMLLNQQRFAFIGSAFALPNELKRFVKLYMQKRDYDYLQIKKDSFKNLNQITETSINNYYREHRTEFVNPETVAISYVALSMRELKKRIKLNLEEIQGFYEENKANFTLPAQWRVAHILFAVAKNSSEDVKQKIKQQAEEAYAILKAHPKQFTNLVKTLSSDKFSGAEGVLPWITAGQTEFDQVMLNLTTPNQILPPVEYSHGFEIFKLIEYKPATIKPFAEVKAEIEHQLLLQNVQTQYSQALEQLTDLSYQAPDSLDGVAQALDLPINYTKQFSRQGGDDKLTKNKKVINAAFSHEVLGLGNNSDPIQLNNDMVIVLRVAKHIPSSFKSLTESRPLILDKLASDEARQKVKQLQNNLLTVKNDPKLQNELLQKWHLQWYKVEHATREYDQVSPEINELAFSIPRANEFASQILSNGDGLLIYLKQIKNGQLQDLDKEQQASVKQQIEASNGLMDYDIYIKDLLRKAKIEKK